MIKYSQQIGMEQMYLNIINATYDKSRHTSVLSAEKLKEFPLRAVLEVICRAIIQNKLIKGIQVAKEDIKLSLFVPWHYLKYPNPKDHQKTVGINKFSEITENKINIQKSKSIIFGYS